MESVKFQELTLFGETIFKLTDTRHYNDIHNYLRQFIHRPERHFIQKMDIKHDYILAVKFQAESFMIAFIQYENEPLCILINEDDDMFIILLILELFHSPNKSNIINSSVSVIVSIFASVLIVWLS